MPYIHQQPHWPDFTWDEATLLPLLAAVRHNQGRLLGRMETLGFPLLDEAGLVTMTREAVTTSAIEGVALPPGEVRSSIARRLGLDAGGLPEPGRDVEGVVEMLLDATRNHVLPLTEERLFNWHAALFPTGRSGMKRISVGAWRTDASGPMQVVSGPLHRERVHFQAPAAHRLPGEMARFLRWFETTGARQPVDPVLRAGLAHFWFVTIHPFDDGNGRIARAVADMALARSDGQERRFYSMSAQLEAERKEYYARLERAQGGGLDITDWLAWFLGCLDRSLDRAGQTLAGVLRKAAVWRRANAASVNERQRRVLNKVLDDFAGKLTTSKYAKLAKCSQDTALRDIKDLLAKGILAQNPGGGRSTSYSLAE
jgi:Fic family protein